MRRATSILPFLLSAAVACGGDMGESTGGTDTTMRAPESGAEMPAAVASDVALACQPTVGPDELATRPSPYDSTTITVGAGAAKVCYSRPSLRGRTMIGGEAVPYGRLWRFGANEPTTIHINVRATIAGLAVEPGSYSLYAIPAEGPEWTLIVNRSTSQWGVEGQYTPEIEAQEVGRAQVPAETLDQPVETFTISEAPDGSGLIAEWQNSRIRIPIAPA